MCDLVERGDFVYNMVKIVADLIGRNGFFKISLIFVFQI